MSEPVPNLSIREPAGAVLAPHPDPGISIPFHLVLLQRSRHLLQQHPALGLTLGYLFLTAVGMIYEWIFFNAFDLQIIDFADPGDFLLVAFRQPLLLLITLLSVWVVVRLIRRHERRRNRSARYRRWTDWFQRKPWWPVAERILYVLLFVGYFIMLTASYADHSAERVLHGKGKKIRVELTVDPSAKPGVTGGKVYTLLGSTTRYLLLYDLENHRTEVIPANNIARLTAEH